MTLRSGEMPRAADVESATREAQRVIVPGEMSWAQGSVGQRWVFVR